MPKAPAFQFYVKDWMSDTALQMCSAVTKGVWINMLCEMWDAPVRGELKGTITAISRTAKCTLRETKKLISENRINEFCFTESDESGAWTIRNWRMFNEAKSSGFHALRQKRYRDRKKKRDGKRDATVTPLSPTPSSTPLIPPISPSITEPVIEDGFAEEIAEEKEDEFRTEEANRIAFKLYGRGPRDEDCKVAILWATKRVINKTISLDRVLGCAGDAYLQWFATRGMPAEEFDVATDKMKLTNKVRSRAAYFLSFVKKAMKED